jgi:hypothetical protein
MKNRFKYNLNIYYQSTIIYFVAFVLYVIVRGQFVEDSFNLIIKDPVLYAFGVIVIISVLTLLYNMNRKRFIEINENEIIFGNKYASKKISLTDIEQIRIFKKKLEKEYSFLRIVRIKLKNRKRTLSIRTSDYENEEELIEKFVQLKNLIENENV